MTNALKKKSPYQAEEILPYSGKYALIAEKLRLRFFSKLSLKKKTRKHYRQKYKILIQKETILNGRRQLIKKIKNKIESGKKVTVYFVAYEKLQGSFDTVYEEFLKDDMFEPKIFVRDAFVRKGAEENPTEDLISFFKTKNYDVVTEIDEKNLPDILFTPRHDFPNIGVSLSLSEAYDKILFVYVPYLWVVENTHGINFHYLHSNLSFFWKSFLPNVISLTKKEQKNLYPCSYIVSGSLKTDFIRRSENISSYWKKTNTKKIIYAAHWSLYSSNFAFGTFLQYHHLMYEYVKNHPEIEMVFCPHPLLKRFIFDTQLQKAWGANFDFTIDEYDDFLKKWKNLPNGNVMDGDDYFALFKSSDAMILDCMSFIIEYGILLKPMCFLSREKKADVFLHKFNPQSSELVKTMSVAYEWNDIVDFIEQVAKDGKNPFATQRAEVVKKYFSVNAGHVGLFIKNDVKESLLKEKA